MSRVCCVAVTRWHQRGWFTGRQCVLEGWPPPTLSPTLYTLIILSITHWLLYQLLTDCTINYSLIALSISHCLLEVFTSLWPQWCWGFLFNREWVNKTLDLSQCQPNTHNIYMRVYQSTSGGVMEILAHHWYSVGPTLDVITLVQSVDFSTIVYFAIMNSHINQTTGTW